MRWNSRDLEQKNRRSNGGMTDLFSENWFAVVELDYNDFIKAMLMGDVDAMNEYMNRVALQTFSYFDTGERASGAEPEGEKRKKS